MISRKQHEPMIDAGVIRGHASERTGITGGNDDFNRIRQNIVSKLFNLFLEGSAEQHSLPIGSNIVTN
jgi:hypothetical protein